MLIFLSSEKKIMTHQINNAEIMSMILAFEKARQNSLSPWPVNCFRGPFLNLANKENKNVVVVSYRNADH